MRFSRKWAMPHAETFSIKPIGEFVARWMAGRTVSIDPFARDKRLATLTNDLNPKTKADYHMDAEDFCRKIAGEGVKADIVLFDPPYSPRQISEIYQQIGRPVGMAGTQNAALYKRVRDSFDPMVGSGGIVLSFGWNSNGMGVTRGYEIEEILLVAHGGGHNDTICVAEKKLPRLL